MKALAGRFRRQRRVDFDTTSGAPIPVWASAAEQPEHPAVVNLALAARQTGRADAIAEAGRVMRRLGLEPSGPLDIGDLVRFVYAQGWLACEAGLASPDMADAIHEALNHPGKVTDKTSADSINSWTVRALQQAVVRKAGQPVKTAGRPALADQ
jgi:hypothetical protein